MRCSKTMATLQILEFEVKRKGFDLETNKKTCD